MQKYEIKSVHFIKDELLEWPRPPLLSYYERNSENANLRRSQRGVRIIVGLIPFRGKHWG